MGRQITIDADDIHLLTMYYFLEMRDYFNTIIGYSKVGQLSPEYWKMDYLDIILQRGELCFELLQMFKNSILVEIGYFPVYAREFDNLKLLNEAFERIKDIANHKGITLNLVVLPNVPTVIYHNDMAIKHIFADCLIQFVYISKEYSSIFLEYGQADEKTWYLQFTNQVIHEDSLLLASKQLKFIQKFVDLLHGEIEIIEKVDNHMQCTITLPIRYEAPNPENVD